LAKELDSSRYALNLTNDPQDFIATVKANREQIDCLIIFYSSQVDDALMALQEDDILLPTIIFHSAPVSDDYIYHTAEVKIQDEGGKTLPKIIEQAIAQFLHLGPSCKVKENKGWTTKNHPSNSQAFLLLQQRRLAEKLKERLGYLGVYYKRNPKFFYRNLDEDQKKSFKQELEKQYREIILNYFVENSETNNEIDEFVNQVFFADMSVSQILEMHMKLMDEFSMQLKLEGRSEEILLDYRLALIDLIAHLCEMYRRSIPREDLPYDLLINSDT
jgi:circadian clock protein KaiA